MCGCGCDAVALGIQSDAQDGVFGDFEVSMPEHDLRADSGFFGLSAPEPEAVAAAEKTCSGNCENCKSLSEAVAEALAP